MYDAAGSCLLSVSELLTHISTSSIFLSNQGFFSVVFFSSFTPLIWCPLPIKRIFYVIEVKAEDSFVLSLLFLPFMAMTFCRSSFWLILHGCVFVGF